jgi:filamentous hemagglutinin
VVVEAAVTVATTTVCAFAGCSDAGGSVGEEVHSKSEWEKLVAPALVVGGGAIIGRIVRSTGALSRMLGSRGTQFTSKTLWKGAEGRIDAENPNPGARPGQIHFQDGDMKYLYDMEKGTFRDAPNRVNNLLEQQDVKDAIDKGFKHLGED